ASAVLSPSLQLTTSPRPACGYRPGFSPACFCPRHSRPPVHALRQRTDESPLPARPAHRQIVWQFLEVQRWVREDSSRSFPSSRTYLTGQVLHLTITNKLETFQ